MRENLLAGYPQCLTQADVLVGESANSDVIGYEAQKLVAKVRKPGNWRVYPSKKEAKAAIKERRDQAGSIRSQLAALGTSPDCVPSTAAVIHTSREGAITFTEIQPWYQGSETLENTSLPFSSIPQDTLQDLRNLFHLNVKQFLKTGTTLDINGSYSRTDGIIKKTWKSLFPLFNASNVLIDSDQKMVYVDQGILKPNYQTVPAYIRHGLDVIGSMLSIGIIDFTTSFRNKGQNKPH